MPEISGSAKVIAEVPEQTILVKPTHVQNQELDPSKPATTTFQDDLTHAGQRKVNLIWEYTQAVIAVSVITVSMTAAVFAMVYNKEVSGFLSFVCGNVVGFYFSRTNHIATGGVGPRKGDNTPYGDGR